jgi:hypothetical protein
VRALTGLSAEQLEIVIAHELGHIKRFDVVVNFLQVVLETLFFFHPAVWWLNKRIRADRENCCDDVAIAACGRKLDYARALATMEDWRGTPALSMAVTGSDVTSRVARLLGVGRPQSGARSAGVFASALVLVAALTAGAASIGFSQILTQAESPVVVPAEAPVIERLVTPVVAPAEPVVAPVEPVIAPAEPIATQVERFVTRVERPVVLAQAERPVVVEPAQRQLLAQARRENRSRDDAEDEPRAPADAPRGSSFIDEMKSVGFDVTDADELIALKIHGITAEYVRGMRDAGLDPDADTLIAMKIHEITPEYLAQIRASGIEADLDTVIAMKIHEVTPEYVAQVRASGLDVDFDQVLAMKIHEVTPEYLAEVRASGIEADIDDVIAMKIHEVTPDDVRRIRALESNASLDDVLAMKIHEVTPEYVEQVRGMGFDADLEDVIAMKIHEVTPEFINDARSRGFRDLTLEQIIQLKNADVL